METREFPSARLLRRRSGLAQVAPYQIAATDSGAGVAMGEVSGSVCPWALEWDSELKLA